VPACSDRSFAEAPDGARGVGHGQSRVDASASRPSATGRVRPRANRRCRDVARRQLAERSLRL